MYDVLLIFILNQLFILFHLMTPEVTCLLVIGTDMLRFIKAAGLL